jgi:hypothetical protein
MKWYKRTAIKIYIYGKTILAILYFFFIGVWFLKVDDEIQKEEDEKLLKAYKEAKEMKITDL